MWNYCTPNGQFGKIIFPLTLFFFFFFKYSLKFWFLVDCFLKTDQLMTEANVGLLPPLNGCVRRNKTWNLSQRGKSQWDDRQTAHSSRACVQEPTLSVITMNTFVLKTTDKKHLAETEVYLPLKQWGLSSAVQRPASPLLASGCAALSFRWTSWGLSHLCSGSRTSCGPQFYNFSYLEKSGVYFSKSLSERCSEPISVLNR